MVRRVMLDCSDEISESVLVRFLTAVTVADEQPQSAQREAGARIGHQVINTRATSVSESVLPEKITAQDVARAAQAVLADQADAARILARGTIEMLEAGRSDLAMLCLRALAFDETPTDPAEVDRVKH